MSLRMPEWMHQELKVAAKLHGHTVNDEVVERLRSVKMAEAVQMLAKENAEMKAMLKELYDLARK